MFQRKSCIREYNVLDHSKIIFLNEEAAFPNEIYQQFGVLLIQSVYQSIRLTVYDKTVLLKNGSKQEQNVHAKLTVLMIMTLVVIYGTLDLLI